MALEVIPLDTTPEAWRVQMGIYRRMSPGKRIELALELSDEARHLVVAGVRSRHPEYSAEQVRLAVFRLMRGKDVFEMVYPGVRIDS
jgi:hypothetical protein